MKSRHQQFQQKQNSIARSFCHEEKANNLFKQIHESSSVWNDLTCGIIDIKNDDGHHQDGHDMGKKLVKKTSIPQWIDIPTIRHSRHDKKINTNSKQENAACKNTKMRVPSSDHHHDSSFPTTFTRATTTTRLSIDSDVDTTFLGLDQNTIDGSHDYGTATDGFDCRDENTANNDNYNYSMMTKRRHDHDTTISTTISTIPIITRARRTNSRKRRVDSGTRSDHTTIMMTSACVEALNRWINDDGYDSEKDDDDHSTHLSSNTTSTSSTTSLFRALSPYCCDTIVYGFHHNDDSVDSSSSNNNNDNIHDDDDSSHFQHHPWLQQQEEQHDQEQQQQQQQHGNRIRNGLRTKVIRKS